jgi:hypothetical protein
VDPTTEQHYAFTPPETIEYVRPDQWRPPRARRPGGRAGAMLQMGPAGSGPNTASCAVPVGTTGACGDALAMAFTDDTLEWWDEIGKKPFVITKRETIARRRATTSRVFAAIATTRCASTRDFLPGHDQRAIHERIDGRWGGIVGVIEWFDVTYPDGAGSASAASA